MVLVTYSDSEGSDTDSTPKTTPASSRKPPSSSAAQAATFQPLVDRSNPRKIVVDFSDVKQSNDNLEDAKEEGPARKRAKIGGGGTFGGFNAMLPAPKRVPQKKDDKKVAAAGVPRKVFSLKTSAAPGFLREADSELLEDGDGEDDRAGGDSSEASIIKKEEPVFEKKGNAMMFKPLSVSRNPKKKSKAPPQKPLNTETDGKTSSVSKEPLLETTAQKEQPMEKPKVNLFGISSSESGSSTILTIDPGPQTEHYEPLIYAPSLEPALPQPATDSTTEQLDNSFSTGSNSLEHIASDLNLSQSEMRQLMGRKGRMSAANAKILTFNTDAEYKSNSALLASMSEQELAAQQHNPVRSIAPGKHSLQQLVNAASNQRGALEESFASGKRNRKEAGTKYGW